jgi:hypothetical protein
MILFGSAGFLVRELPKPFRNVANRSEALDAAFRQGSRQIFSDPELVSTTMTRPRDLRRNSPQ